MNTINTNEALGLIKNSKGRTFSVVYKKQDGSVRLLNGRLGVKKGVTGKGLGYDPAKKGLIPVFDMKAKGYRMVTIANIQGLKIDKKEYAVTDVIVESERVSLWELVLGFFK